jgi:hypothetical protein
VSRTYARRTAVLVGRPFLLCLLVMALVTLVKPTAATEDYSWTGNADADGLYAATDCDDQDPNNLVPCDIDIVPEQPIYNQSSGYSCTPGITVTRCYTSGYCYETTYLQYCN